MSLLNDDSLESVRASVEVALDSAAKLTLPRFRQPLDVQNKLADGFDPVTIADQEAEQCLRDALCAALPHADFLGEENSQPSVGFDVNAAIDLSPSIQSQLTWVVDPIDGTRAFITGLPLWGTLVALNDGVDVLFGALDQPFMGERFIGYNGRAERHAQGSVQTLRTRAPRPLSECILQTTTPDMFQDEHSQRGFAACQSAVAMTRYGGDCYLYALLAMGGIDAVIESSLQPYDIQALIPIVQGAGGVISDWAGEPCLQGGNVIASANREVHEQLLQKLQ